MGVKDTYARKSLRYNFSPTLADHPGIFHAKLPPAGASQLVALTPPLTVILPCSSHRFDALSSFHGPATPVDPNCRSHKKKVFRIAERMRPSSEGKGIRGLSGRGQRTADGRSFTLVEATRGYSYSMTYRRPFTFRLTPNG